MFRFLEIFPAVGFLQLATYEDEVKEMDGQSKEEYIGSLRRCVHLKHTSHTYSSALVNYEQKLSLSFLNLVAEKVAVSPVGFLNTEVLQGTYDHNM